MHARTALPPRGCALRARRVARAAARLDGGAIPAVAPVAPRPEPLDPATGFFNSDASRDKVPERWAPLLAAAADAYRAAASASGLVLVGVYLRGSLPRGLFIDHVSDVDTFALALTPRSAGADGLPRAQQLLAEEASRLSAAHQADLHFTKVECKLLPLEPASSAAAWLAAASQAGQQPPGSFPAALLQQLPASFVLKSQSIALAGLDLGELLPDVAALPPRYELLPSLTEDVGAAVAAEGKAPSGRAGRAACWALKRCLRAAFELAAPAAGTYTRDLFWCCHIASQHMPQLAQQLEQALALYVQLATRASTPAEGAPATAEAGGAAAQPPVPAAAVVTGACRLAADLAETLDDLFLAAMLTEEPGWLTKHVPLRPPSGGGAGPPRSVWAWAKAWAGPAGPADHSGSGSGSGSAGGAETCDPPQVKVAVAGSIRQFDWQDAQQQAQALRCLAGCLGGGQHWEEGRGRALAGWQQQLGEPLLLKGLAADWQAAAGWGGLAWLAGQQFSGLARVSASLQFPYVEPMLLKYLAGTQGLAACPSFESTMSSVEFCERLQPGCRLPPLLHQPREFYYLQAALPQALAQQLPISRLLAQLDAAAGSDGSTASAASSSGRGRQLSQQPRLWVSPHGAVSPCHYDLSPSFLVQLAGRKRMLFFDPGQLPLLYPYPDTHMLRRRASVNLAAPDYSRHPLAARTAARQAWLEPGDAVFFPAGWAHHTESYGRPDAASTGGAPQRQLDGTGGSGGSDDSNGGCVSVSLTFRLQQTVGPGSAGSE